MFRHFWYLSFKKDAKSSEAKNDINFNVWCPENDTFDSIVHFLYKTQVIMGS